MNRKASIRTALAGAVRPLLGYMESFFYQRTQRERIMIVTASALAIFFLVLIAGSSLTRSSRRRVGVIAAKERALAQVVELSRRYTRLSRDLAGIEADLASGGSGSLFAELEGLAAETLSREKIGGINPSVRRLSDELEEEVVDITVNGVTLRGLVELLYRVEKENRRLGIARLRIKKRFNNPHLFDAQMSVSRIRPTAGAEG